MSSNSISHKRLVELLEYNPDDGTFTNIDGYVYSRTGNGYVVIYLDCEPYGAHRLAWFYIHKEWPKDQIDHINHIRNDNRIVNLRPATKSENQRNATRRKDNSSGVPGVSWNKYSSRWHAQILVDGKRKHLGYFTNLDAAASARQAANIKYGFHQNHGADKPVS